MTTLGPLTVSIDVRLSRLFNFRLRLALMVLGLAARVANWLMPSVKVTVE